jgi:hypothetical protein
MDNSLFISRKNTKIWLWVPAGPETKIDCAGEAHQPARLMVYMWILLMLDAFEVYFDLVYIF